MVVGWYGSGPRECEWNSYTSEWVREILYKAFEKEIMLNTHVRNLVLIRAARDIYYVYVYVYKYKYTHLYISICIRIETTDKLIDASFPPNKSIEQLKQRHAWMQVLCF